MTQTTHDKLVVTCGPQLTKRFKKFAICIVRDDKVAEISNAVNILDRGLWCSRSRDSRHVCRTRTGEAFRLESWSHFEVRGVGEPSVGKERVGNRCLWKARRSVRHSCDVQRVPHVWMPDSVTAEEAPRQQTSLLQASMNPLRWTDT